MYKSKGAAPPPRWKWQRDGGRVRSHARIPRPPRAPSIQAAAAGLVLRVGFVQKQSDDDIL